jgi:hypothetical protein
MLLNPSALQSRLRPDARFRKSLSGEIQTTYISQVVTNSPRQATSREVGWCNCESKKSLTACGASPDTFPQELSGIHKSHS